MNTGLPIALLNRRGRGSLDFFLDQCGILELLSGAHAGGVFMGSGSLASRSAGMTGSVCWTPDHATALRAARSGERRSRIRSHFDQGHLGNRAAARAVAFRPLRLGAARRARTPLLLRAARLRQPLRFGRHPSVEIFEAELLRS